MTIVFPISLIFVFGIASAQAPETSPSPSPTPAEEKRLSAALFREGLKKRGLTELLDQHLKEFPPASPSAAMLMAREVKMSQFVDRSIPAGQRRAAIAEANKLLEQLISENAHDVRAMEWRLTLAHSLLYQEGESFATNLLYYGGTDADRSALAPLTGRALQALRDLIDQLNAENQRVDALSPREFEQLEQSGLVEKLDRLKPSAEYLLLWALFYNSLARDDEDPVRTEQLEEIIKSFAENTEWLSLPHDRSRVQVPALLLAGMSERRLRDHVSARQYLERSVVAADRITDESERNAIRWTEMLGAIEAGRNARDEERFDDALGHVVRLRAMPAALAPDQYGIRLSAALLERSILLTRAQSAEKAGRTTDARNYREEAWRALATLAAEEPDNRSLLYAILYRAMTSEGGSATPRDPIEMCALLAGTLEDAAGDEARREELLRRAITEGEKYLAQASGTQRSVTPEILFQMGTAYYRLSDLTSSADKMLEIARRYPNYGQAGQAALIAVQLTAQMCIDATRCPLRSTTQNQYRLALETLLAGYPNLEASSYWRFYYAQLLEEIGDYSGAAAEFALVERGHEHYLEAAFRRVRALTRAISQSTDNLPASNAQALAGANQVSAAYRELVTRATALSAGAGALPDGEIKDFVAQGRVWLAEAYLLKTVHRPEQSLELLVDFETTFGAQNSLLGRVWQVRLRAFQSLGRLEEATKAVPAFVAADPRSAGPTLQSLYDAMLTNWQREAQGPDGSPAPFDSEVMLLVAEQIVLWTQRNDVPVTAAQKQEAELQLAQTHLLAGNYAKAAELFQSLFPQGQSGTNSMSLVEAEAVLGHAEALSRGGDPARALAEFNQLATRLPPENPIRWKALLGDLEARTTLNQPPAGILQVIAQQRRLFPDLGGPQMLAQFERIERENIRRRDQSP